jgi:RecB family endonuclease NucS
MMQTNQDELLLALSDLRLHLQRHEFNIHREIGSILNRLGIVHQHEAKLSRYSRVDFLCADGTAIEVKRGKPNTRQVEQQVQRYCEHNAITRLILVSERGLIRVPQSVNGKAVHTIALSTNWGISL